MRLWTNKPIDDFPRQLILDVSAVEDAQIWGPIRQYMCAPNKWPNRIVGIDKRHYIFDYTTANIDRLMLMFPGVEMSAKLQRKVKRAQTIEYDPSEIPDIDIDGFIGNLYDFQKVSVAKLIDKEMPLLDDLGLGKTIQSVAVAAALQTFPVLVICPKSGLEIHKEHYDKYSNLRSVIVEGHAYARHNLLTDPSYDIYIVNFDILIRHKDVLERHWPMVIVDEFHRLKNPQTMVFRTFKKITSDRSLLMSGTPILNKPEESWVMLNRIWPQKYPNYNSFARSLVLHGDKGTGQKPIGYNPNRMGELREFIAKNTIRRRKDQVIKELPKEVEIIRLVDLGPEQRKLYNKLLQEARMELKDGSVTTVSQIRTMILRLRQACFSPELYGGNDKSAKVDAIKEDMAQLVDERQKALIGSQWSRATRIIQRELQQYNPAYIDGKIPRKRRLIEQDRFNTDETVHCLIGTIRANREAISLSEATYVLFADEDWSPKANDQFRGRSAAGGLRGVGKEQVTTIRYFARDTIDQYVSEILREKDGVFRVLWEADGGTYVPRSVMSDLKALLL